MEQTASEATKDYIRQKGEDPRVIDLQIAFPTQQAKFRKVLSQRSLATDFVCWELKEKKVSKVDILFKELTKQLNINSPIKLSTEAPTELDTQSKGYGYIVEFIRLSGSFKEVDIARDGID